MIRVCLYDCLYCNNSSLRFNLLLSLLIVHCNVSISLGYLSNTLSISLLSMLQRIDLNDCLQRIKKTNKKIRADCDHNGY